MMKRNGMWLSLIASVGVGAATYYAMSRKEHTISQAIQKIAPIVSEMSNKNI